MAKKYDLVVVGGGTSGLEAAKTAAENGLRVALVEMKTNPAKVQRACAQMFLVNMDYFYNERIYFSQERQRWILPVILCFSIFLARMNSTTSTRSLCRNYPGV